MAADSPRMMPAGEFKTKCLALMDAVRETREEIIITKHGHPVARLAPCADERQYPVLWGMCRDEIEMHGDIVSPPPLDEEWLAEWAAQWNEWLASPGGIDEPSASEH